VMMILWKSSKMGIKSVMGFINYLFINIKEAKIIRIKVKHKTFNLSGLII
jgi:hypothetical protein